MSPDRYDDDYFSDQDNYHPNYKRYPSNSYANDNLRDNLPN